MLILVGEFLLWFRARGLRFGLFGFLGGLVLLAEMLQLVLGVGPAACGDDPFAIAHGAEAARHGRIQKGAVMADQDQRAVIGEQHVLQQFQRLHVEIIGRFVHHHQIG